MRKHLAFLVPMILDSKFTKSQLFCNSKNLSDLLGKELDISSNIAPLLLKGGLIGFIFQI